MSLRDATVLRGLGLLVAALTPVLSASAQEGEPVTAPPSTAPPEAATEAPSIPPPARPPDQDPPHPGPASAWAAPPSSPPEALRSLEFDAFAHVQYALHEDSYDEEAPDGRTLNRDGFTLRRARLRARWARGFSRGVLELDAGTNREIPVTPRRVEATVEPWPWLVATAGLTRPPFGAELPLGNEARIFLERTSASQAFFPGETDLGAALSGAGGPLRWSVALMNGAPPEDGHLPYGEDPASAHDVIGRLGLHLRGEGYVLDVGTSYLTGEGLHAGIPATKSGVTWSDLDEDSVIDTGELSPQAARTATPSESFDRWAVGADTRLDLETLLGVTTLEGEVILATNLDRSGEAADPVLRGFDQRSLAATANVVQAWRGLIVGFRWETFAPDLDLTESRRGGQVPVDRGSTTYSPLVGFAWAETWRLVAQYDHVVDTRGRDVRGVPVDLDNDVFVLRLQAGP